MFYPHNRDHADINKNEKDLYEVIWGISWLY